MSALLELAARCEAATGPDRHLGFEIFKAVYPEDYRKRLADVEDGATPFNSIGACLDRTTLRYTASIDAALTLVPESLESDLVHAAWSAVGKRHALHVRFWKEVDGSYQHALALALCAAALRARAAA